MFLQCKLGELNLHCHLCLEGNPISKGEVSEWKNLVKESRDEQEKPMDTAQE